jgi:hypothetical protein
MRVYKYEDDQWQFDELDLEPCGVKRVFDFKLNVVWSFILNDGLITQILLNELGHEVDGKYFETSTDLIEIYRDNFKNWPKFEYINNVISPVDLAAELELEASEAFDEAQRESDNEDADRSWYASMKL